MRQFAHLGFSAPFHVRLIAIFLLMNVAVVCAQSRT